MDQEEIKKSIAERFDNLQPEIQAVILSPEYEKSLYTIIQKHSLSLEEARSLELNTTLVLIGNTNPKEYGAELEDDLKIPKEKIVEIIKEVNESIFKNIQNTLMANFEREDKEEIQFDQSSLPGIAKIVRVGLEEALKTNSPAGQNDFLKNLSSVLTVTIKNNKHY